MAGLCLTLPLAAASGPAGPVPSMDALPRPLAASPVDLGALAERLASQGGVQPAAVPGPRLLVFVSLAMPVASLRKLAGQAERCGAVLLLRGLRDGSLVKTAAALHDVAGDGNAGLQIDPRQFARYNVRQVPTFVLARGTQPGACTEGACAGDFVSVAGDVALDYALLHIMARAPGFSADAGALLQRIREEK